MEWNMEWVEYGMVYGQAKSCAAHHLHICPIIWCYVRIYVATCMVVETLQAKVPPPLQLIKKFWCWPCTLLWQVLAGWKYCS